MASAPHSYKLLILFPICLWVSLISPACSLTCSSQKLKIHYPNCTDLPTLNATLHYSYDAANSSLSVAFLAAPPTSDGWVAWGINPTAKGMVGTQALIAHKSNGSSVVVQTYSLESYASIVQSNLSFAVWNLSAADSGGTIVIYATVKVPDRVETLNQVWQVGPVSGGRPGKHAFNPENLQSTGELAVAATSITPVAAPSPAAGNGTGSGSWVWSPGKMGLLAGASVLFLSWALV